MSKIEIRTTVLGEVSSKFIGKHNRGNTTPEAQLAEIQRQDKYWEQEANPLVDSEGNYHDPKKCIEWLNNTNQIQENLLTISALTLQFNPLFRKHLMTKSEREASIISWNRDDFPEGTEIERDLAGFVWSFNHYHSTHEIQRVDKPKSLRLGFFVKDKQAIFLIKYSELCPIWRPKSEHEFAQEMIAKWVKKASGVERVIDEKVGLLFRTVTHDLGPGWAGILEHNLPALSTTTGGKQHAMPLPRDRYKVMWVHLSTVTRRKTETYSADELDLLIKESRIEKTDGHETTPICFQGDLGGSGGSQRENEEWERMCPRGKWRKSNLD